MRTIMMPRTSSLDTPSSSSSSSSSSSKRNFKWVMRRGISGGVVGEGGGGRQRNEEEEEEEEEEMLSSSPAVAPAKNKKSSAAAAAVSRFRSVVMTALIASGRQNRSSSMGSRITCTLYGHRRGHVHLAFQAEAKACPVVLLELATPTSNLVREMASGLVRIALECERKGKEPKRLMEEATWRAYCNGRKCGYAVKRECGAGDWKVLKAVEPVSMGAGVLPKDYGGGGGEGTDGEMMYMRARFERVVGSRDSEAFYMMNPDGNAGTELSIYFLRV